MVITFAEAAAVVCNTLVNKYPQISRAYIFGSFAEGEQSAGSDLDVLVELDCFMGLEFISMIQDIENAAGTSVDIITTGQAYELEKKFGYDILKKAKPVYERTKN
jgi:predicted nucleotidyltransferase